jgi:hypothetical protein
MNQIRPENFSNVVDFAHWYISSGMPICPPNDSNVFLSDDATSSCLYRSGRFQVEIYLIHQDPLIPIHEHPEVDNVELPVGSFDKNISKEEIKKSLQLSGGRPHGESSKIRAKKSGFMLLSAQMWHGDGQMSTIASKWKGRTAGPKHEALIRKFNPDALIFSGYADTSSKQEKEEIL